MKEKDAVSSGERTLILSGEEGRCPRGTQFRSGIENAVWGGRRTLASPRVRTLSISEGKGCRSEGLLLDPALGRIDLADLVLYVADLVLYVADLGV